jgi:hypothetical protein
VRCRLTLGSARCAPARCAQCGGRPLDGARSLMQASKLSGRYKVKELAAVTLGADRHCCGRANAAGDDAPAAERALNAGGPLDIGQPHVGVAQCEQAAPLGGEH